MKRISLIVIVLAGLCATEVWAQQQPIFSLYRENAFVLNPAIAGSDDHGIASLTYRDQWTAKVDGRPRTFSASYRTPVFKTNIGLGGHIVNDITGPTQFTGLTASFAYHISFEKINPFFFAQFLRNSKISLGLSASLFQYRLNSQDLLLDQPNDNLVASANTSTFLPNAGLGIYYYYDKFYLGFSIPNIIPLSADFTIDNATSSIKQEMHYFMVVGGKIPLGDDYKPFLTIEPQAWFRNVKGAPWQLDVYSRFLFKESFWVGMGYRTSNVIILDAGFKIKEQFRLGYAMDYGFTSTGVNLGAAHELVLAYHLQPKKRRYRRY